MRPLQPASKSGDAKELLEQFEHGRHAQLHRLPLAGPESSASIGLRLRPAVWPPSVQRPKGAGMQICNIMNAAQAL